MNSFNSIQSFIDNPTKKPIILENGILNKISSNSKANMLKTGSTFFQAGAYGLVKLNSLYNGPTIDLKRIGDTNSTEFFAQSTTNYGTLKTSTGQTLSAFLNGQTTVYVTKWYDQTGNGYHAINEGNITYNTTNHRVDFASNYLVVPNDAFPTGNSPYSYLFTPDNQTTNGNTIFQGGTFGSRTWCLSTMGYNCEGKEDIYNNSWYANVARYGVGSSTKPNGVKIADCYDGTDGATGRILYINNESKTYNGGIDVGGRLQTGGNNFIGHSVYDGELIVNYTGSLKYFFWAPILLPIEDITILQNV